MARTRRFALPKPWSPGTRLLCTSEPYFISDGFLKMGSVYTVRSCQALEDNPYQFSVQLVERPGFTYLGEHFEVKDG